FDVEALSLDLDTKTMTLVGNLGVADRFDIGVALPFVPLSLNGRRVDTYRGTALVQATGSASASGPGDLLIRGKYNVLRRTGSGLAVGGEARLPTGDAQNLLGTGEASIKPRVIASLERDRVALHGDLGYAFGGLSGELVGRRLSSAGRLTETTEAHPTLVGVDTIRLTSTDRATERMSALIGFKW